MKSRGQRQEQVSHLIATKLPDSLQQELTALRHTTGLSVSEIVRESLTLYMALHKLDISNPNLNTNGVASVLRNESESFNQLLEKFLSLREAVQTIVQAVPSGTSQPEFFMTPTVPSTSSLATATMDNQMLNRHMGPGTALSIPTASATIRLYVAEEQQILREAIEAFFAFHQTIEIIGSARDTATEPLAGAVSELRPDVALLGVKTLTTEAVEKLRVINESCPDAALVVLSSSFDARGIRALREFYLEASVGYAYILKDNIHTVEDLVGVIAAAAKGRTIFDPEVMEGLVTSTETKHSFIKELTTRELQVLHWMSKGYRNETIASVLGLDPNAVRRTITRICEKSDSPESMDARVHAIGLYLRAMEMMPTLGRAGN